MRTMDELKRKLGQLLKEPDSASRYDAIGVILGQVKDWDNAERYLGRAYALDPTDIDISYHYASALYQRHRYSEAAALCRDGLKIDSTNRALLERLGDCCYLLGEYEDAAKAYVKLYERSGEVVLS
ncbi:MAG TPA: tetratricopeptide repeat protein [Clostridia bacterium]|nr:tetratricopeptide repeat protein [Clostridia bacterium]